MNALEKAENSRIAGQLDADALYDAASAQPALFGEFETPVAVVRSARSYAHTGKAITSDEKRVAKVAVLAAAGFSVRRICRETGESRNTVTAALDELERLGKLEPVKEVVGRRLARLVDDQMDAVSDLLDKPKLTDSETQQLKAGWVGVGVGLTHMGSAKPTQHVHAHVHQVVGSDAVREYLSSLNAASATQADVTARKSLTLNVPVVTDALSDAVGSGETAVVGPAAAAGKAAADVAAHATGGGGGVDHGGGRPGDDGLPLQNFGAETAPTQT